MEISEKAKRYAISISKRYSGRGISFVELYKICLDTINDLNEKHKSNPDFDVTKDVKLDWYLRNALTRRIAEVTDGTRIDVKYVPEVNEYLEETKKYIIQNAKIPSDDEMANILGVKKSDILRIKASLNEGKEV